MGDNLFKMGNGLKLANFSTANAPTGQAGVLYFDTTLNKFRFHDGSTFVDVQSVTSDFLDNAFRISDDGDSSKKIAFQASGISTATVRTITMPDSNVNLGLIATAVQRDGSVAFTAAQSMGGFKLTSLADPTVAQDAATKAYVDGVAQGLDVKASVRAASTANVVIASALENGDSLDSVTLSTGDRVLLKDQSAPEENGIYVVVASGAASRASDMDAWSEVPAAFTFVEEGTVNADKGFVCTSNQGGTLGTTAITFSQFSSAGSYTGGNGVLLTGNAFSVRHDGEGLTFSGSDLALELDGSTLSKSASGLKVATGGINNNEINAAAAIAYSKLALTGSIVNADINASAAIAYSKLNLSGSIVNADINASAAIAYSKLSLAGSIVNADINASAAIDASKLADGSVSNAEFQRINSLTSNAQDQLDAKLTNVLTDGNIFVGNVSNVATSVNPSGDIDISNAGVFSINAGVIVNADINASAAIDASKIADGSVSSAEFQRINSLTSNAQDQLDARVVGPASATDNAIARFDGTTGKLVQDSTNGSLSDSGSLSIADILKRGDGNLTDFVEEEYIHSSSLTASTTAVLAALTFNSQNYKSLQVEYMVSNGNNRRTGKLLIVCDNASGVNASNVSLVDMNAETADVLLSWSAAINGSNIEISYTTGAGTFTMRSDVKRFKAA